MPKVAGLLEIDARRPRPEGLLLARYSPVTVPWKSAPDNIAREVDRNRAAGSTSRSIARIGLDKPAHDQAEARGRDCGRRQPGQDVDRAAVDLLPHNLVIVGHHDDQYQKPRRPQ